MPSILFVCSANQCRSPMAEALLKAQVAARGEGDRWRIASAGVRALEGWPATAEAQGVMAERGLDISGHRARPASAELLEDFDVILVMEAEHQEALIGRAPHLQGRIHLFRSLVGEGGDFEDPVGRGIAAYRQAADELERILNEGFPRMLELIGGG